MEKVISWIHSCKTSEQLDNMDRYIVNRFEGMELLELREEIEIMRGKVGSRVWDEVLLNN